MSGNAGRPLAPGQRDPAWVRWGLTLFAVGMMTILVVIPVANIFAEALSDGVRSYWRNLTADPQTRHAVLLSLVVAPLAVLINTAFGVAAAWCVTRYRFFGRRFILTVLDLPFAVSPVVAGLMFVLIFGDKGWFGPWLKGHNLSVMYSIPGIILATTFVTLPLVARELIPVMEAVGSDEEVAALSLGANGWQMLWRVTLPNIRWGLLYGIILCNARALGEFGAAFVVSGHVAGKTNTVPLQIEQLFQGFDTPAAFALSSALAMMACVTLFLKVIVEGRIRADSQDAAVPGGRP